MKTKFAAMALAATVIMGATAPTAQAMEMEFNMLTGAVYQELMSRNLPTDKINDLRLTQIAAIKAIAESDDSEGSKTQKIKAVLNH